jgi:hypothetical protein
MPAVEFRDRVLETGTVAGSATSITTTAVAAVSVGDCLFVAMRGQGGIHVTGVSDSVGNTYTLVGRTTTNNTASLFYSVITTAITTSTTVTLTLSGANASSSVFGASFRNVDPRNPIGSTVTGTSNTLLSITITSATANRYGSMLLSVPTINDGTFPNVTSGSITRVATTITSQNWMHFGYRQNDNLSPYSLTYQKSSGSGTSNWGYVMAEINRVPSDFLTLF